MANEWWGGQGGLANPDLPDAFWRGWLRAIAERVDGINPECDNPRQAVYSWLLSRALENMTHSSGQRAWRLWDDIIAGNVGFAVIWGCGGSSGEQELSFKQFIARNGTQGTFWPCLVGSQMHEHGDAMGQVLVIFYCPALGWGNSRPWRVDITRVHVFGDLTIDDHGVVVQIHTNPGAGASSPCASPQPAPPAIPQPAPPPPPAAPPPPAPLPPPVPLPLLELPRPAGSASCVASRSRRAA